MSTTTPTKAQTLYFAFGSNLHLAQMSHRCPSSLYAGFATLQNYRFQINERGYANIVFAADHIVEGLCYFLNDEDEEVLDGYEGVSVGAYEKVVLEVEVEVGGKLVGRSVREIVEDGLLEGCEGREGEGKEMERRKVLCYASGKYVKDGVAWEEYVGRMNAGVRDARKLGMSEKYVVESIRPWIRDEGK